MTIQSGTVLIFAEYLYVITAFFLALILLLRIYFDNYFKNNNKLSPVIASLGALFIGYVFLSLLLALLYPLISNKIIMLLCAISPFILGKLVSYEKLKLYSIIQVICVILSMIYVIILW